MSIICSIFICSALVPIDLQLISHLCTIVFLTCDRQGVCAAPYAFYVCYYRHPVDSKPCAGNRKDDLAGPVLCLLFAYIQWTVNPALAINRKDDLAGPVLCLILQTSSGQSLCWQSKRWLGRTSLMSDIRDIQWTVPVLAIERMTWPDQSYVWYYRHPVDSPCAGNRKDDLAGPVLCLILQTFSGQSLCRQSKGWLGRTSLLKVRDAVDAYGV